MSLILPPQTGCEYGWMADNDVLIVGSVFYFMGNCVIFYVIHNIIFIDYYTLLSVLYECC